MGFLFKTIITKGDTVRGIRIVLLSIFSISFLITNLHGSNFNMYIGIYKFEIGCGIYLNESM
jgi:hypothetical protein